MDGVIKREGRTTFVPLPPPRSLHLHWALLLHLSSSCYLYLFYPYPTPPPTFSSLSVIFFCPPCTTHPTPPHTPASSVSPASAINLFSSHLTAVEWVISGQFASARPSPADHSRNSTRPHYLLSLFCFSEVANYLNAKFNLLLALWLLLIRFFF